MEVKTFRQLVVDATSMMTSLKLDSSSMPALSLTEDQLASMDWSDAASVTWVEAAVLLSPGCNREYADSIMDECLALHDRVAMRMATHLQLTADNIGRQPA